MNRGVGRRPRLEPVTMRGRVASWLLWLGVVVPDLVVSAVLALLLLPLLPSAIAWLLLLAWAVVSITLGAGRMSWLGIRLLIGGRRLTQQEASQLVVPTAMAATVCDTSRIEVGLSSCQGRTLVGTNIFLIERNLVHRYLAGKVQDCEMALQIAYGVARLQVSGSASICC